MVQYFSMHAFLGQPGPGQARPPVAFTATLNILHMIPTRLGKHIKNTSCPWLCQIHGVLIVVLTTNRLVGEKNQRDTLISKYEISVYFVCQIWIFWTLPIFVIRLSNIDNKNGVCKTCFRRSPKGKITLLLFF